MEQDKKCCAVILENRTNTNISLKQHNGLNDPENPTKKDLWRKQLDGTLPVTYIKTLDIPPKTHKTICRNTFGAFSDYTVRRRALIHIFLGDHKLNDGFLCPSIFGHWAKLIFYQDNHACLVIKAVSLKWSDYIFLVTPKRCEGRPEKTIATFQIQANPDAQGMANKEIHNWDDIVVIFGRGRVTGEGAETYYDATEAMADEEDDFDISSHSVQSEKGRRLPSTLSTTQGQASIKRVKKNVLLMLFMMLLCQLSNTLKVRKKNEDNRPSAKVIHEVVSSVGGLTRNEVFKATQRLMNGNVQEFELLQDLRDDEKEEWIKFLLDN